MNLFPYSEPRPEQDQLIQSIKQALDEKKSIIIHAPTGLGKTAASIAPALEVAIKKNLNIFFLTSRHTQHIIALETLKQIREKHTLSFTVTDLLGKKHMCLQDGVFNLKSGDFHEYCRKLREENKCEHYNNTKINNKNTPIADITLNSIKLLRTASNEKIIETCRERKLCPYEIASSLAKESSVIIADYSYIFNPEISKPFLKKIGKELGQCIVIVDEAHNLPKRIIDYATSRLSLYILRRAINECKKFEHIETGEKLEKLLQSIMEIAKTAQPERIIHKEEFIQLVENIYPYDAFIQELDETALYIIEKQKSTFVGSVTRFLQAWQGEDMGHARILSSIDKKISINYKCLDPSIMTKEIINQIYSIIAMSGTLTPTSMYRDMLGFENVVEKEFKNPFPDENRLNLLVPRTTTKFTSRSEEQYHQIAGVIAEITNRVPGNCFVFFPSYSIRDNVFKYYSEYSEKSSFLESTEMTKQDKFEMLEKIKFYKDNGCVLLGTTHGNFSEGIDMIGDYLKCVVIVGLPLQHPDLETQESIKYYDQKFKKGWDYGYIFPAFNKVLQSAGRCIRSETDRGIIVFLDERYAWPNYIRCFPEDMKLTIKRDYLDAIEEFFDSK